MNDLPKVRVNWLKTYRIIRSIFPPIDLFEDISAPEDWEAIASAEAKLNPRSQPNHGDLAKVPVDRRVSGPGSTWVMAPFVHCSSRYPTRFSTGEYGVYYASDRTETAIAETVHHHARMMASTNEEPGWTSQFRLLIGSIDQDLHDIQQRPEALDPDDYRAAQQLGRELRASHSQGVVYPSVRDPEGQCFGVFWPDVISIPKQSHHYAYHWNGSRIDYVKRLDGRTEVWTL